MTQFYVMQAVHRLYPERNPFMITPSRNEMFDKICGTDYVRRTFSKRLMACDIADRWRGDAEEFRLMARRYYIYQ